MRRRHRTAESTSFHSRGKCASAEALPSRREQPTERFHASPARRRELRKSQEVRLSLGASRKRCEFKRPASIRECSGPADHPPRLLEPLKIEDAARSDSSARKLCQLGSGRLRGRRERIRLDGSPHRLSRRPAELPARVDKRQGESDHISLAGCVAERRFVYQRLRGRGLAIERQLQRLHFAVTCRRRRNRHNDADSKECCEPHKRDCRAWIGA